MKSDRFKSKLRQFFATCWFQFCAEVALFVIIGIFPSKPNIFSSGLTRMKSILNGVKFKEQKCGENHLKV